MSMFLHFGIFLNCSAMDTVVYCNFFPFRMPNTFQHYSETNMNENESIKYN